MKVRNQVCRSRTFTDKRKFVSNLTPKQSEKSGSVSTLYSVCNGLTLLQWNCGIPRDFYVETFLHKSQYVGTLLHVSQFDECD